MSVWCKTSEFSASNSYIQDDVAAVSLSCGNGGFVNRDALIFKAFCPIINHKAKNVLEKTGLEKDQLRQIWDLSDIDKDDLFDMDEYVVAMYLCDAVMQKGRPIPSELPASIVPPSKRHIVNSIVVRLDPPIDTQNMPEIGLDPA